MGLEPRSDFQDQGCKVLRQLSTGIMPAAIHRKMFFDYKSQGIPSQYSTVHVLKASLTNLLAPCHRNTYHYQIKLLYLYSQKK